MRAHWCQSFLFRLYLLSRSPYCAFSDKEVNLRKLRDFSKVTQLASIAVESQTPQIPRLQHTTDSASCFLSKHT